MNHRSHYRGGEQRSRRQHEQDRYDDHIVERHYYRQDEGDPRRYQDSGRPNSPNYGREVYAGGPGIRNSYGYNQGRNAASNVGGRAYGQSYGQYFQGSDNRRHSNPRHYEGDYDYDYGYQGRDYAYDEDFNDRYDEDRYGLLDQYRHEGFQGSGNNEGFGRRSGHRNEGIWFDDSEYRRGHAQNHRGYGKYGSR